MAIVALIAMIVCLILVSVRLVGDGLLITVLGTLIIGHSGCTIISRIASS